MTPGSRRARFDTTHWSLVTTATHDDSPGGHEALAALCQAYWYPLYAYARRQGYDAEGAQDLTQAFFATLLEKQHLRQVSRARGRFRSFLLAAMRNFMLNDLQRERALKRGGGHVSLALEWDRAEGRYLQEPVDEVTPETVFDRRWALTILERVLRQLRHDAARAGKDAEFHALKGCLTGSIPHGSYRAIGAAVDMTEGAVKVAIHRLRQRFRQLLRREIAQTVLSPEDVDDELRYLFQAISR